MQAHVIPGDSELSFHELQQLRQGYCEELRDCVQFKMEMMQMEADEGKRSDQTFQRWLGDQILYSAKFLSIQFVEEVLSYAMRHLQRQKLQVMLESVQPDGRTEKNRAWLHEKAQSILQQLNHNSQELNRCLSHTKELSKLHNDLTLKNPFYGRKSQTTVKMLAVCQTQTSDSILNYAKAEMHHLETVARLYLDANGATPDFDRVILRDTEFRGGKKGHDVCPWPPVEFFDGKRKSQLNNYWLTTLHWGMGDNQIESLRFTMSNGDMSPKFGRKSISHFCAFEDKITRMMIGTRDNRVCRLTFYCGNSDSEYYTIKAGSDPDGQIYEEDLVLTEGFIGFKVRLYQGVLSGICMQVMTSRAALEKLGHPQHVIC